LASQERPLSAGAKQGIHGALAVTIAKRLIAAPAWFAGGDGVSFLDQDQEPRYGFRAARVQTGLVGALELGSNLGNDGDGLAV
jgi:hypothetical protein